MIMSIGNATLWAIMLVAAGAVFSALLGIRLRSTRGENIARYGVALIALLMTAASVLLLIALINNDFRLDYVYAYSSSSQSLPYKIGALWGGQAGSLLLWVLILTVMALVWTLRPPKPYTWKKSPTTPTAQHTKPHR